MLECEVVEGITRVPSVDASHEYIRKTQPIDRLGRRDLFLDRHDLNFRPDGIGEAGWDLHLAGAVNVVPYRANEAAEVSLIDDVRIDWDEHPNTRVDELLRDVTPASRYADHGDRRLSESRLPNGANRQELPVAGIWTQRVNPLFMGKAERGSTSRHEATHSAMLGRRLAYARDAVLTHNQESMHAVRASPSHECKKVDPVCGVEGGGDWRALELVGVNEDGPAARPLGGLGDP